MLHKHLTNLSLMIPYPPIDLLPPPHELEFMPNLTEAIEFANFIKTTRGQQYIKYMDDQVTKLEEICKRNGINIQKPAVTPETNNSGNTVFKHLRSAFTAAESDPVPGSAEMHTEGSLQLMKINSLLSDFKTPASRKNIVLKFLTSSFDVCKPGMLLNLKSAYQKLAIVIDELLYELRDIIHDELFQKMDLRIPAGMEIHYFTHLKNNYCINHGLKRAEDPYAASFEQFIPSHLKKILLNRNDAFFAIYTPYRIVEHLFAGLSIEDINQLSESGELRESLENILNAYGNDPDFKMNNMFEEIEVEKDGVSDYVYRVAPDAAAKIKNSIINRLIHRELFLSSIRQSKKFESGFSIDWVDDVDLNFLSSFGGARQDIAVIDIVHGLVELAISNEVSINYNQLTDELNAILVLVGVEQFSRICCSALAYALSMDKPLDTSLDFKTGVFNSIMRLGNESTISKLMNDKFYTNLLNSYQTMLADSDISDSKKSNIIEHFVKFLSCMPFSYFKLAVHELIGYINDNPNKIRLSDFFHVLTIINDRLGSVFVRHYIDAINKNLVYAGEAFPLVQFKNLKFTEMNEEVVNSIRFISQATLSPISATIMTLHPNIINVQNIELLMSYVGYVILPGTFLKYKEAVNNAIASQNLDPQQFDDIMERIAALVADLYCTIADTPNISPALPVAYKALLKDHFLSYLNGHHLGKLLVYAVKYNDSETFEYIFTSLRYRPSLMSEVILTLQSSNRSCREIFMKMLHLDVSNRLSIFKNKDLYNLILDRNKSLFLECLTSVVKENTADQRNYQTILYLHQVYTQSNINLQFRELLSVKNDDECMPRVNIICDEYKSILAQGYTAGDIISVVNDLLLMHCESVNDHIFTSLMSNFMQCDIKHFASAFETLCQKQRYRREEIIKNMTLFAELADNLDSLRMLLSDLAYRVLEDTLRLVSNHKRRGSELESEDLKLQKIASTFSIWEPIETLMETGEDAVNAQSNVGPGEEENKDDYDIDQFFSFK